MINRATAYELHWNAKELLVTLYYTDEEGRHLAEPTTFALGIEAAMQLSKSITGTINLNKLKESTNKEPKPLKPDTPILDEQQ